MPMRFPCATVVVASLIAASALAQPTVFNDAIGDIDPSIFTGGGTLDIVKMEVSDTASDLIFTLTVNGNITTTDWGIFMIGIANQKTAGTQTGNAWGRPINMNAGGGNGMTHWIGSWVNGGGGSLLYSYNGTTWSQAPAGPGLVLTPGTQSTIAYTVTKASLDYVEGDVLYFDAYSSGTGGGDSAVDALSNPNIAITAWNQAYTSQSPVISRYPAPDNIVSSLEEAATKSPFDPATAANWSAGGAEWTVDTTTSANRTSAKVLVPNGDFSAGSNNWVALNSPSSTFPPTGGNPGGYGTVTPTGGWGVLISPPEPANAGGGIPIASLSLTAGGPVTFTYDSINLSGPGPVGGFKWEAWGGNAIKGNTGDIYPTVKGDGTTWETYTYSWTLPAGTDKLIFVPLWAGGANTSTVGFDNVGVRISVEEDEDSVKAQTTDGQSTYREYTVTGPAVVDFWWKVSSEELYDTFSYAVDGVNQQTISGEVDWTYRTLTLPAGTHTIRWTYTKDGSDAVGQDAGWLDDFAVYPASATLKVRDGSTALSGITTVDFSSADQGSAGLTKSLIFANEGYTPLEVQLSLPEGSPFTFEGGVTAYDVILGRGETLDVPITLSAAARGTKTAQLTIIAPDSTVIPPQIALLAEATLQVRDGSTVLSGTATIDFGSADYGSAGATKSLTLVNVGYVPLDAELSLPEDSPFTFEGGVATRNVLLGRGEVLNIPITLIPAVRGPKSAQLTINAPGSSSTPPEITLTGNVLGPVIGVATGGSPLASGQTIDLGLAPRTLQFTISNTGNVGNLEIAQISATGNFKIAEQPQTSIAPQSSTTFAVLALGGASGVQSGTLTITSNDTLSETFTINLSSKSLFSIGGGIAADSVVTSGTGGAVGWDFANTQLPSGQSGQALKTGTTPNNGGSVLEFTAQTAGVVSWSWKVGSQENFDWLLCEVDGQEVAGISAKNGVWQTQVVQVPAGANVRWVYRKDASASAGEDAGYLADVEFRSFAADQPFSQWGQTHGIYDPQQRMPKSGLPAMFGWLGGFRADEERDDDTHSKWILAGRLTYRYPVSKTADGTQQILYSPDMSAWTARRFSQRVVSEDADRVVIEATAPSGTKGFFKVVGGGDTTSPVMALIPAGSFSMGDAFGEGGSDQRPVHTVNVSAFYMDKYEVSKALWDEVAVWAARNGYDINASSARGKAADHPVHSVTWYSMVKWCNARSQKKNLTPCYTVGGAVMKTGTETPDCNFSANGYRLPTEAEWEKAARGGLSGKRFPWGDTITHSQANYYATIPGAGPFDSFYSYDVSPTRGFHPTYETGSFPYSSPVGSFAPNGYGLYDMAGNMWEWCWDWYSSSYYASSPSSDPRGATSGSYRVVRGGGYATDAFDTRAAARRSSGPSINNGDLGFRCVRSSVP